MITLKVEPYCDYCDQFEHYCSKLRSLDGTITIVQCEKKDICARLASWIKQKNETGSEVANGSRKT